ncbi:uncharacterized protein LOC131877387 isoform X2 [Tigriopus californicus]|uniref:uncharacterized protein LOC131877387 isoform X2 n=1 Tax=Tigriopus californicus TaxID=6832 RepID=UPI0027DA4EEF|nr:uncharacterized protein LOC131877387 isoform X2 [Tigriopus californicus]
MCGARLVPWARCLVLLTIIQFGWSSTLIQERRHKMMNAKWLEVRTNFIHQEMIRRSAPMLSNCEESAWSYQSILKQLVHYQLSEDYWQKLDWVRFQNLTQVLEFDPFWKMGLPSRTKARSQGPILLVDFLHTDMVQGGSSISLHALPFPSQMTFQYAFHRNKRTAEHETRGILPVFYFPLHIGPSNSSSASFCPLDCFDNVEFCGQTAFESKPTANPRSCQRKCALSARCSYFTWRFHYGSHRGTCSLYDAKAPCTMKSSDLNTLSGPRECSEHWFHFNFTSCQFTPLDVPIGAWPNPPRFSGYDSDKVGALRQLWDKNPVQTPPNRSPQADCNLWSTALCGYNLAILANVQTFEHCRQVCQVYDGCSFWTWNPQNRVCFVKNDQALCGRRDTVVLDIVSGPKVCLDDQFSAFDPSNCSQPNKLYSECLSSSPNQTPIDGVSSIEIITPKSTGGTTSQTFVTHGVQAEQQSHDSTKPPDRFVSSNFKMSADMTHDRSFKMDAKSDIDERSSKMDPQQRAPRTRSMADCQRQKSTRNWLGLVQQPMVQNGFMSMIGCRSMMGAPLQIRQQSYPRSTDLFRPWPGLNKFISP